MTSRKHALKCKKRKEIQRAQQPKRKKAYIEHRPSSYKQKKMPRLLKNHVLVSIVLPKSKCFEFRDIE